MESAAADTESVDEGAHSGRNRHTDGRTRPRGAHSRSEVRTHLRLHGILCRHGSAPPSFVRSRVALYALWLEKRLSSAPSCTERGKLTRIRSTRKVHDVAAAAEDDARCCRFGPRARGVAGVPRSAPSATAPPPARRDRRASDARCAACGGGAAWPRAACGIRGCGAPAWAADMRSAPERTQCALMLVCCHSCALPLAAPPCCWCRCSTGQG